MTIIRSFPRPCPHDLEGSITTLGTSLCKAYLLASLYEFEFHQRLSLSRNRLADILHHIHDISCPLLKVISWHKLGVEFEKYCACNGESGKVSWYVGQMNRSNDSNISNARNITDPLIRDFLASLGLKSDDKSLISATKEGCRILAVQKLFNEPTMSLCFTQYQPSSMSFCQLQETLPLIHEDPVCTLIFQSVGPWYLGCIKRYDDWFDAAKTFTSLNISTTEQAHPHPKKHLSNPSTARTSKKRRADNRGDTISPSLDVQLGSTPPMKTALIDTGWIPSQQRHRVPRSPETGAAPREDAALFRHSGKLEESPGKEEDGGWEGSSECPAGTCGYCAAVSVVGAVVTGSVVTGVVVIGASLISDA
jgi:hypothetical protein